MSTEPLMRQEHSSQDAAIEFLRNNKNCVKCKSRIQGRAVVVLNNTPGCNKAYDACFGIAGRIQNCEGCKMPFTQPDENDNYHGIHLAEITGENITFLASSKKGVYPDRSTSSPSAQRGRCYRCLDTCCTALSSRRCEQISKAVICVVFTPLFLFIIVGLTISPPDFS